MSKLVMFFAILVLISSMAQAQKISGLVNDDKEKGLEKTTVSLLRSKDSSVIKLSVTNKDGMYYFQAAAGTYLVSASHVGYALQYSKLIEVSGDVGVPIMQMFKAAGNLKEVTVTAQKPIVEVRADKTILNVEGTINAVGNDALELLRRSPGVMVDKDDNLSLAGKNGVQVFIDGKPSPLSGADLANYLKSLQSAQIEAIEIITNPSAKYEAAGNAGIINIKLKKNKAFGTNGSISSGYVQGTYAKFNEGLNLNYRNKSVNLFGTYNYNNGNNLMQF
ncbi:MAG: TonB-dependent receptor, partial [Chitinophagaceae bacterium]